jgi:hypothetical protein
VLKIAKMCSLFEDTSHVILRCQPETQIGHNVCLYTFISLEDPIKISYHGKNAEKMASI